MLEMIQFTKRVVNKDKTCLKRKDLLKKIF